MQEQKKDDAESMVVQSSVPRVRLIMQKERLSWWRKFSSHVCFRERARDLKAETKAQTRLPWFHNFLGSLQKPPLPPWQKLCSLVPPSLHQNEGTRLKGFAPPGHRRPGSLRGPRDGNTGVSRQRKNSATDQISAVLSMAAFLPGQGPVQRIAARCFGDAFLMPSSDLVGCMRAPHPQAGKPFTRSPNG